MVFKWNDTNTLLFLEHFQNYQCLWNHKVDEYKDKTIRDNAMKSLISDLNLEVTEADVKNKIKTIRTRFTTELTKIKQSTKSGCSSDDVYEPSLYWYKHAEFLSSVCVPRQSSSGLLDVWRVARAMSGMTGNSMLRTRRRDVNLKPNRRLDRKSSRGMLYENEDLRLRTININAEVERGQSDIKKLKRENDHLKREIMALRYEYDRLDTMLRERRSSPEHSDGDSASVCSACPDCISIDSCARVVFNDLSVVPEEGEQDGNKSGVESPCSCHECHKDNIENNTKQSQPVITVTDPSSVNAQSQTIQHDTGQGQIDDIKDNSERVVDVLVHDAPIEPQFFQAMTSPQYITAPPPGFIIAQQPRFHTGGNIEDLLGEVQATPQRYIQHNSVFMCNTRKVTQKQCTCKNRESTIDIDQSVANPRGNNETQAPKYYVTEKNIELNYDYPRGTPVHTPSPKPGDLTTTTEVASTVVFVERRIPVKPKKFDFFFRSRSAPVGDNEEPIYATVTKLPKRLRKMELANLEKEVSYKEPHTRVDNDTRTDSESQVPQNDDTSLSEPEKSVIPQRPDSPKAKKRKRFSLTFKKRERKRREKKEVNKNGVAKNGGPIPLESDNERLIDEHDLKGRHCTRHRPRNTMSSSSSGPRYKRDSYQEITTSHSEHERTNSICSSVSLGSACTHKSRKLSVPPQDSGSIPWCGCWGAGCV